MILYYKPCSFAPYKHFSVHPPVHLQFSLFALLLCHWT